MNDYRNPVVAEAMKVLGYVNQFNRGIARVKLELKDNGNPAPVFDYDKIGVFGVTVFSTFHEENTIEKSSQKSSQVIIDLIKNNSNVTTEELASQMNMSRRNIAKHIAKLKEEGKLKRIGPDKGGYWEIQSKRQKIGETMP